jgi:hypothetical protein
MTVMVPIPGELAARFGSEAELGRRVVEALALEEYRAGRMPRAELHQVLGFRTGGELESFLKAHGEASVPAGDEFDQDLAGIRLALRSEDEDQRKAAATELVERFRAFAAQHTLGGLNVKDLISEGRR